MIYVYTFVFHVTESWQGRVLVVDPISPILSANFCFNTMSMVVVVTYRRALLYVASQNLVTR